jgi:enoyl-CoA hydratase
MLYPIELRAQKTAYASTNVMSHQNVVVETEGPLTTVTVSRPKVLNALDDATVRELTEVFSGLPAEVRCVILTGAGEKAFVAGADIAAMAGLAPAEALAFAERGHRLGELMESLAVPIIAAVNGFALGGGLELALACDFAFASSTARLGLPEVGLGIIPGFGGTQRLARRIGPALARELIYSGNVIAADEALRLGLLNGVTPPADLLPTVRALAEKIAGRAPLAVAAAKRAMREGADLPLGQALALERQLFAALFSSGDQKEGMKSFLEKRPPRFTAR